MWLSLEEPARQAEWQMSSELRVSVCFLPPAPPESSAPTKGITCSTLERRCHHRWACLLDFTAHHVATSHVSGSTCTGPSSRRIPGPPRVPSLPASPLSLVFIAQVLTGVRCVCPHAAALSWGRRVGWLPRTSLTLLAVSTAKLRICWHRRVSLSA